MSSHVFKARQDPEMSQLAALMQALSEPILITDKQGKITDQNHSAEPFFVLPADPSFAASSAAKSNRLRMAELVAFGIPNPGSKSYQVSLKQVADGMEIQFEASCSPVFSKNACTGAIIVLRQLPGRDEDIRASLEKLRAAEEVVRQDRDRLNLVIENVGDPIVVADSNAKITLMDSLARELFGNQRPSSDQQIAANQARLDSYLTSFTFSFLERQNKTINFYSPSLGGETEYAARSGKIYDAHGQVAYTVTVLRDFSTWRRIERLQVERRMLQMEKFAATGKLAGTIAHEINNPMEAIKNAIYLLKDRLDPASQPIYEALKSETDRVTRIVRQMLGLYRNAGHFGSFDVNVVVDDTLTLFSRPLAKAGVSVEKRLGRMPAIKGSADQFRQLLSNLVVNSQDSMPHGGKLIIRTRYTKSMREGYGKATIVVADKGCGIPEDIRDSMFEPFVTSKGERGTGLGLWIVKGIVEGHNGRIQVRSTPGRGTIFKLIFPVSPN